MGSIESTIAFLFRPRVKRTDAQHRQRTAAILRPITEQAADVAACLIDNERKQANDTPKAAAPDR